MSFKVDSAQVRPVRVRYLTWLCYAGMVCLAAGMCHYPILLSDIAETFRMDAEESGRAGSFMFFGTIAAVMLLTPVAHRYGEKTATLAAIVLCVSACVGEATAVSYAMLCAVLFLQGLGCGGLDLVLSPIVAALHPHNVTAALSFLHSFYSIGAVASTLGTTALLSITGDWRLIPQCVTVIPVVLLLGMFRETFPAITSAASAEAESHTGDACEAAHLESQQCDKQREPTVVSTETPLITLLTSPTYLLCVAMMFLTGAGEQGPIVWLPAYVEGSLAFNDAASGLSLTAFSIWMTVGRLLGGTYCSKWNPYAILVASAVAQVALINASVLTQWFPWVSYACATMIGLAISMMWPTVLSAAAMEYPNGGTKMYGVMTIMGGLGATFMSWAIGLTKDTSGSVTVAFWTGCIPGAILCALAVFTWRLHRARDDASAVEFNDFDNITNEKIRAAWCSVLPESPRSNDCDDQLPCCAARFV